MSIGLQDALRPPSDLGSSTVAVGDAPPPRGRAASARELGDFEILEEIARGGMGIVYRARQRSLNRIVAVKTLIGGEFSLPDFLRRFRKEAEAAATLRHPNIVVVHDSGEHEGIPFLAMEYVEGHSLAELTLHKPLPPRRAASYLQRIATAVHYAHGRGILHRDLKPANILVDADDQPRITDFGLAMRFGEDSELTLTGQVLGSPSFMPPEQASFQQEQLGPQSDVYSLGAILYQAVTGRPPFLAGSLDESLRMILRTDPVAPRLLNPHVPKDLETIILKCLEKEPAKRYETAAALADECDRFLKDEPIRARPAGMVAKFWRWCRRNPLLATLGVAVVLLLLTITIGSVVSAWRISNANLATQTESRKHRHSLYVGNMNVAWDAYSSGNLLHALSLLRQDRPIPGLEDFRGFEWRYLRRLCQGAQASLYSLGAFESGGVRFVTDGRLIASTSDGRAISIFDVLGQRPLAQLTDLGAGQITAFALALDGDEVATACEDLQLRIWDLSADPPRQAAVQPLVAPVPVLAYSSDGSVLLSLTDTGLVVWRAGADGQPTEEARLPEETRLEDILAVSSDLRAFAFRDAGTHGVLIWSPKSQATLSPPPGPTSSIECAAFSFDGRYLATGSSDGSIRLWDLPSRSTLAVLLGHRNVVASLAFSHDHRTLASCGLDNTIMMWDVVSRNVFATLKGHLDQLSSLSFSIDDRTLASLSFDGTVRTWGTDPKSEDNQILEHSTGVYSCAFDPEGRRIAAFGTDGTLLLWDTEPPGEVHMIRADPDDAGYLIRFTDDGRYLATQGVAADEVDLWDTAAREWVGKIEIPGVAIYDWDLMPGTDHLAVGTDDGKIRVFDIRERQNIRTVDAHPTAALQSVTVAPRGHRLATVADDGSLKIWDATTFAGIAEATTSANSARQVLFFPEGDMLLTTHWDGSVQVWSAESLQSLRTFKPDYFYSVTISQDGRNIAFGCADQTIQIWNLANIAGDLLVQKALHLGGHRSIVGGVSFSRDGKALASCSEDGSIRVWRAPSLSELDQWAQP